MGEAWAFDADWMDTQLNPLGLPALDGLRAGVGESILDVGCGAGATTLELAHRVGPEGSVMGIDLSTPLIKLARRRASELGVSNVTWIESDVQSGVPAGAPFDAVFSRLGVMFFADPVRAFTHLHGATAVGGRLAFVCWQELTDNDIPALAWAALSDIAGLELPLPPAPREPGPYAFADPQWIREVLNAAQWRRVEARSHVDAAELNEAGLDRWVKFIVEHGPAATALANAPDALRSEAAERVRGRLSEHARIDAGRFSRAVWVVTAWA